MGPKTEGGKVGVRMREETGGGPQDRGGLTVTVEEVKGGTLDLRESKWSIGLAMAALVVSLATLGFTLIRESPWERCAP